MENRLKQALDNHARSNFISSSQHSGFVEFELTLRQFEKIKLTLPKPFYMMDPYSKELDKNKKKLMETFQSDENSKNDNFKWTEDMKEKIMNPIAKEKEFTVNKKKKKEEHTSKTKETDKSKNGKKHNLMKNKSIMKKKENDINSSSQEQKENSSEFLAFAEEKLQQIQEQNFEEPNIAKDKQELLPKSEPSFKENEQFYEHINDQNFEDHILKAPLEVIEGGEHFFQYRPIRCLSSGQPRFISRQELEYEQIENESNSLRYQFGLPFYSSFSESLQKLNQKQKNFCNNILHKLKAHRSSQGFRVPVDPDVQGVPDYFNVIYEPMDLQTITKKVCKDKYQCISEFHADISKILLNSYKYNPRETVYFEAAIDFEDYYHYLLRDAEQRSEEYASESLAKHPKLKKGEDFGELEFTEQTPIKKIRRDSKARIRKSKSIIDNDEYHPEYQVMGQQFSIRYEEFLGPKKGKSLHQEYLENESIHDREIIGNENQEEQKQLCLKNENKEHEFNYHPEYNMDRQMGVYMHSSHLNHPQQAEFQPIKYATPEELESEDKPEYVEPHYMMYPHYYPLHHPPMNQYMGKIRNHNIFQNREAFHNRQNQTNKRSVKNSRRNDDYNDDDDYFIPEEELNYDSEKGNNSKSDIKITIENNIEKENVKKSEEDGKAIEKEIFKKAKEDWREENMNENEGFKEEENRLREMQPRVKEQQKELKKLKSQSNKPSINTLNNTNSNLNQSVVDNGTPQIQESIVLNSIHSTFGHSNFEAIIEPSSTGPSITSKTKPISKIVKIKKKEEEEDEEYVESRYSKKNKERSRKRNHAAENSSKIPKKRGRHPKYQGKSASMVGKDEEMIFDIANSQKQSNERESDPESEQNEEGSQIFESFEHIINQNKENGKVIAGEKRFEHEEIFMEKVEIFEEDEGINVEEII